MIPIVFSIVEPIWNVTKNFTSREVMGSSVSDSGVFEMDQKVFDVAQYIRDAIEVPVNINSAFRSRKHNEAVGGAKNSYHLTGQALDLSGDGIVEFMLEAYDTKNVHFNRMRSLGLGGLGIYDNYVHIDTRRMNFAFWDLRKKKVFTMSIIPLLIALVLWLFMKKRK